MMDADEFSGLAARLSALAGEIAEASNGLETESARQALRLKALTMEHYALELELIARGERS